MTLKGLLDIALYYLSVPRCISCDEFLELGEMAFCPKCSSRFKEIANRNCSVCSNVLSSCSCSNDYLESLGVRRVVKTMRYRNRIENLSANKLIYSLKTGAGCYWNPILNGGTVIRISSDGVSDIHHHYVDVTSLLS